MMFLYLWHFKQNRERKENYILVYDITVVYSWEANMPTQLHLVIYVEYTKLSRHICTKYDIRYWGIKWIKWIRVPCQIVRSLCCAQFGTLCRIISP